ncbi:NusA-like transcription termination signal-binding factor [Candidatus Micrarchaeota archaeon]|nr:NusA-like transcription termination signal-binding factor [Candidatus Micrarchaeota archaeon]
MAATLSMEDIQLLNMLEQRTGAQGLDVVRTETGFVFVVASGQAGKAIGKGRENLRRMERELGGKSVDVVETADTLEGFARNAFKPALLRTVELKKEGNTQKVFIKVDGTQRGLAIGRNGETIKKARMLLQRRFGVDDVKIV